jgi:rubrerythrin
MDIFEFAMKMEKDGEQYYRELAAKSKINGLKRILILLAENEVEHYNVLKSLKENTSPRLTGYTIVKDAKNIFTEMKENNEVMDLEGTGTDLYRKAVEIEKKSEAFYREKAGEVGSEEAAKLLLQIAEEERRHAYFMENMVIFLSRPQAWIENAEFNHLEEY